MIDEIVFFLKINSGGLNELSDFVQHTIVVIPFRILFICREYRHIHIKIQKLSISLDLTKDVSLREFKFLLQIPDW